MRVERWIPFAIGAVLAVGGRAEAQAIPSKGASVKGAPVKVEIPRTLRPPAGMCRVWLDNVPAAQQPAPTDCTTAIRNRPPNGRVIFAEERPAAAPSKTGAVGDSAKKIKKPGTRPPSGRDAGAEGGDRRVRPGQG